MLLDKFNKKFERELSAKVNKNSELLNKFKKMKGTQECFEIFFEANDEEGNLIALIEDGIKVILKNTRENKEYYALHIARKNVGTRCSVTVRDVDIENNIVYVVFYRDSNQVYNELLQEFKAGIDSGKKVEVYGTIRNISQSKRKAVVNIFNIGLTGVLYVKDYTNQYLDYFTEELLYEFDGNGKQIPKKFIIKEIKDDTIILSYEEDIWNGLEKKCKPSMCMVVECISVNEKYKYYWGKTNLVPVNIQVDYKENMIPIEGNFYNCVLTEVDEQKHILRAKTLNPLSSKNVASIKFYN